MPGPFIQNFSAELKDVVIKPFHITRVEYPCPDIIDEADTPPPGQFVLFTIRDSKNRYEPKPLISDAAVIAHSFRYNKMETSFFSVETASMESEGFKWPRPFVRSAVERLIRDMEYIEAYAGCTSLLVNSFRPPPASANPDSLPVLQIVRKTKFCLKGLRREDESTYIMTTVELQSLDCDALWMDNIIDLIKKSSDRAYLHVKLALKRDGVRFGESEWKPRRQPNYEEVMNRTPWAVDPCSFKETDEECAICREPLAEGKAVSNCPGKHTFHLECLLHVCYNDETDRARCPLCRTPYFTDKDDQDFLKFGIIGKTYHYNDRYNAWENFERSCADLDKRLAENDPRLLTCNKRLYKRSSNT